MSQIFHQDFSLNANIYAFDNTTRLIVEICTLYPNVPMFLHRYICHISDISQLCFSHLCVQFLWSTLQKEISLKYHQLWQICNIILINAIFTIFTAPPAKVHCKVSNLKVSPPAGQPQSVTPPKLHICELLLPHPCLHQR